MERSLSLPAMFKVPGRAAELLRDASVIGLNATGEIYDWIVNINRLRIESFAKRRFSECYEQLDGGDIRLMTAFLEPEWMSNTWSLLYGRGSSEVRSEYSLDRPGVVALVDDAFGPLAMRDNSFVVAQDGAYDNDERWFFINGIATSRDLARLNVEALARLFNRKFITIHNPTQGPVHDLVEAALQKLTNINTEPVARAFVEITAALLDPMVKKVVVIGHSQGTIVTGDVLDLIYCSVDPKYFDRTNMNREDFEEFFVFSHGTLNSDELRAARAQLNGQDALVCEKLELYMFANAASRMCYLDCDGRKPRIESFANERDIVTRLGVLASDAFHAEDLIRIDGPVFTCRRYGHLLNTHYLPGLLAGEYKLLSPHADRCIGSSVHEDVLGNPCDKNPQRVAGDTDSRLMGQYLNQAAKTGAPAGSARPKRAPKGQTLEAPPQPGGSAAGRRRADPSQRGTRAP